MASSAYEIVIGVVSGVITAVVLFFITRLWTNTALPLIKEWRYQGVDISGSWKGMGGGAEIALDLEQSTLELKGLMHVRYRSPESSFDLSFHVAGQLWEGYATLGLKPVSRAVTSVATVLLKVAGGGVALEGQLAYRNINIDKVQTMEVFLNRAAGFTFPGATFTQGPATAAKETDSPASATPSGAGAVPPPPPAPTASTQAREVG